MAAKIIHLNAWRASHRKPNPGMLAGIQVAQNREDEEDAMAQRLTTICQQALEDFSNDQLVELTDEAEFMDARTPLEFELIVRLGAHVELERLYRRKDLALYDQLASIGRLDILDQINQLDIASGYSLG